MNAFTITIYVIKGSQFVAKVLAALESRKIDHQIQVCPLGAKARAKMLPSQSGSSSVPEMKVVDQNGNVTAVKDSEAILHWIDEHMDAKLYPNTQASELSTRASDKTLAAMVWYYNWVNDKGYHQSMRRQFAEAALPSFLGGLRGHVVDFLVTSVRQEHRQRVAKAMGLEASDLDDEERMNALLIEELKFYQSHLKQPNQLYLLSGDLPTAADFSVYAQINRLIGDNGAYDYHIYPCKSELKEEKQLDRLWQWHNHMCETTPVHFSGVPQK